MKKKRMMERNNYLNPELLSSKYQDCEYIQLDIFKLHMIQYNNNIIQNQ